MAELSAEHFTGILPDDFRITIAGDFLRRLIEIIDPPVMVAGQNSIGHIVQQHAKGGMQFQERIE